MRTARTNKLRSAGVALVLAAVAGLLAACDGGSASPGVASLGSTTTTTTAQSAHAGTGGGDGGGGAASAGNGAPGGGPHAVMVMAGGNYADKLEYAQCMRSHGVVDFPDPSSNGTISVTRRQTIRAGNCFPTEASPPPRSRHRASPNCSRSPFACAPTALATSPTPLRTGSGSRSERACRATWTRTTSGSRPPTRPARASGRLDNHSALERNQVTDAELGAAVGEGRFIASRGIAVLTEAHGFIGEGCSSAA